MYKPIDLKELQLSEEEMKATETEVEVPHAYANSDLQYEYLRKAMAEAFGIDGALLEAGDRVLVTDGADAAGNGIYVVTDVGERRIGKVDRRRPGSYIPDAQIYNMPPPPEPYTLRAQENYGVPTLDRIVKAVFNRAALEEAFEDMKNAPMRPSPYYLHPDTWNDIKEYAEQLRPEEELKAAYENLQRRRVDK